MAFQLLNPDTRYAVELAITSGQVVAAGDLVRLASGRVRRATSGGSDLYGIALSGGTGDAGGTVLAKVQPIDNTSQLRTAYATVVAAGATLDIDGTASGVTTSSNADVLVQQQDDGYVVVQVLAARAINSGVAGGLLSVNDMAALQGALGTPGASEPFATFLYILGQLAGGKAYAFTAPGLAAPGNTTVTSKVTGISPAAGDKVIFAAHMVTADSTLLAIAQIGATDFDETLVSDSGVKLVQINATDWSSRTIWGIAIKVA